MDNAIMVKMVMDAWHSKIDAASNLWDALTDEELHSEVAPGRNRGIYLLGHLIAVHDHMLPLLGFGEQAYPQLTEIYITNADRAKTDTATTAELRQLWKNVNATLVHHFDKMSSDDWFTKHTAVSAEDFAKEPHRNKLNIIINRTNHLSYHTGQIALLKK